VTTELTIKQKLFYVFPVLFCFCLPFGGLLLSALVIGWVVTSLFNLKELFIVKGFRNSTLMLMFLFFIMTALSALFSKNKNEALFSIEVKLSMIFFPYLLFCFNWPVIILKRCLIAFVSGCFFACVYLILRAGSFALQGHSEYFFYTLFSDLIHTSYFSMYLILAITVIVMYYPHWFKGQKQIKFMSALFIITFIITIFLCYSKMGMIAFFVCLPLLIINRFKDFFNWKKTLILIAGIVVLVFFFWKLFPAPFERLNSIRNISLSTLDKTSSESTTVRILIWEQCIQLIKNHFLFGTGVGDINDVMAATYKEQGMTGALEHRLNAHNQYLQTFVGMGVFGFVVLLLLTFGQLIKGIIRKHFVLTLTMVLIVLNFLVESMLQTAAGMLFFVFFLCFFSLEKTRNEIKN
jgi:O-antigen ligase